MNAWKLLLPVPVVAAFAMVPQDPPPADPTATNDISTVATLSELSYISLQGTAQSVPARNVVEIRFLEDRTEHLRLELLYENGDYSLIDAQAFHLIRSGSNSREVRLVRGKQARMRFPRLP